MDDKERTALKIKLFFLGLAVVLVFSLLTSRLWTLQMAKGSEYAAKSKGNTLRYITIPAPRGDILDSKGRVLATSEPRFAITLDWLDLQNAKGSDLKQVVNSLARYVQPYWETGKINVNIIAEDILAKVQMQQFDRYEPVVVMENIPLQLQAILAEHQQELPGISVEARPYRTYPMGTMAGHLVGYVREVSEGELKSFQDKAASAGLSQDTYQQGDIVGKMGIENSYDLYLRGKEGSQLMEVDNTARPVDRLNRQDSVVGDTVQMTIDTDLQKAISDKLDQLISDLQSKGNSQAGAGAAVVIEVKTGRVLAMVSKPDMNPNDLISDVSGDTFNQYFGTAAQGPRLGWNRAMQETYAPGSTFKMITGVTALQDGKVSPNDMISDSLSSLSHPNAAVQNTEGSFGRVNLFSGLAHSVNNYFEVLGERVMGSNPNRLSQVAHEFGLGVKSGIDIPGETSGVSPSAQWKEELNGPRLKQVLETSLQKLKTDTDAKLAQATSDKERKKIQAASDRQKQQIMIDFNNTYKWEAGWQWFDTYNMSIGQGDNKYTILQLADYVATIVNGGHHMKPYLVDKVIDPRTHKTVFENKPNQLNQVEISPDNLNYIKMAMREVIRSGTGENVFTDIPQFTGGGKTGTAQIGNRGTALENDYNGTFVAFAPYDDPQIAFAAVVEHGHQGANSAALIAHDAFLQYFKSQGWTSSAAN